MEYDEHDLLKSLDKIDVELCKICEHLAKSNNYSQNNTSDFNLLLKGYYKFRKNMKHEIDAKDSNEMELYSV